jgi:rare lipoprotein A
MVASAEPVATTRTRSVDLDAQPAAEPEPAPVATPIVQAYAPQQPRTITPSAPVVATLASTVSTPVDMAPSVRAAPLPPNRPFDLDTIANAAKPVAVPATLRTTLPPMRASLFAAPEKGAGDRLAKTHPLNKLAPQSLQSLARN